MKPTAVLACGLAACAGNTPGGPPPGPTGTLELQLVASGLSSPLYLTAPPGDARLFIVEQAGSIRIVRAGQLLARPFLDIRARVDNSYFEDGLLSVACWNHNELRELSEAFAQRAALGARELKDAALLRLVKQTMRE